MDNPAVISDFQEESIRKLQQKLDTAEFKREKAYADYSAIKQK